MLCVWLTGAGGSSKNKAMTNIDKAVQAREGSDGREGGGREGRGRVFPGGLGAAGMRKYRRQQSEGTGTLG